MQFFFLIPCPPQELTHTHTPHFAFIESAPHQWCCARAFISKQSEIGEINFYCSFGLNFIFVWLLLGIIMLKLWKWHKSYICKSRWRALNITRSRHRRRRGQNARKCAFHIHVLNIKLVYFVHITTRPTALIFVFGS